jgi:hypothetical protein
MNVWMIVKCRERRHHLNNTLPRELRPEMPEPPVPEDQIPWQAG